MKIFSIIFNQFFLPFLSLDLDLDELELELELLDELEDEELLLEDPLELLELSRRRSLRSLSDLRSRSLLKY